MAPEWSKSHAPLAAPWGNCLAGPSGQGTWHLGRKRQEGRRRPLILIHGMLATLYCTSPETHTCSPLDISLLCLSRKRDKETVGSGHAAQFPRQDPGFCRVLWPRFLLESLLLP